MQDEHIQDLLTAIIDILETGLPQDAAVLHFIHSTYGELRAQQLAALIADPDDPQAETLRELLLFPGPDTALALEPAMDLSTARLRALQQHLAFARIGRQSGRPRKRGTRLVVAMQALQQISMHGMQWRIRVQLL